MGGQSSKAVRVLNKTTTVPTKPATNIVESVTTKSQIPPIQQTSTIDDIPSTSSTKPIEEKFVPLPENEIHFKDNKLLTNLSQMDLTKRPVEDFHNEMPAQVNRTLQEQRRNLERQKLKQKKPNSLRAEEIKNILELRRKESSGFNYQAIATKYKLKEPTFQNFLKYYSDVVIIENQQGKLQGVSDDVKLK